MRIEGNNLKLNFIEEKIGEGKKQAAIPFSEFLKNSIENTNKLHLQAEVLSQKLVTGEISDIHQVMIATEKASLALQFTIQVRNKLVEAYQEIMRMQI